MATQGLLQQLPPQHLTRLCADMDFEGSGTMQAVAALSGLRVLQLCWPTGGPRLFEPPAAETASILAPLAAGLQQLMELHIEPVTPLQLLWLPPNLHVGTFVSMGGRLYSFMSQQPVDALATLSALQQLTSLNLALVQRAQPRHLQLLLLQELLISVDAGLSDDQLLQIGHLTHALSGLQKLQLKASTDRAAAAELARLSRLSCLQELELTYYLQPHSKTSAAHAAAVAAAWGVLPVTAQSYWALRQLLQGVGCRGSVP
ncbi:hypothetical protein COO60DRAFT_1635968 [Scenedesmus sp. NREL 46B-D3]|nr:hypothetical protein COO60DRAFT_1635968 [Scenedesmus sp. NREL 46B-D3]